MQRARFLALIFASSSVVAIVAANNACGPSTPSRPIDAGSDARTTFDGDIDALGKDCLDREAAAYEEWANDPTGPLPAALDHDVSGALLGAASAAWAAGDATIPLSPSKCTVLMVKREGGKLVSETLVRAPFKPTFDQSTYQLHYVPTSIARWTYTAAGESFRGDYDGDGFDEERAEVTYGVGAVREHHAPSNDAITTRHSGTVVDGGGLLQLVDEELVNGTLTKTRDERVAFLQRACQPPVDKPPPPPSNPGPWQSSDVRACTGAEQLKIANLISSALQKGTGCLFAAGMQAESDRVLKTVVHANQKIECIDKFSDPKDEFWAANDRGYMNVFPDGMRIIVNSGLLGATNPQNPSMPADQWTRFQEGTIGHELFHTFDGHDRDLEASGTSEALRRGDQVYACEYLCFGSAPNECHLAACQKKKVSTSWKGKSCSGTVTKSDISKIEKARGDGVSIAPCNGGHQVGAVCKDVGGKGTQVQFCDTLVECNAACGAPCESKSVSCLPECR
jgi:hypothetical protein